MWPQFVGQPKYYVTMGGDKMTLFTQLMKMVRTRKVFIF